MEACLFSFRGRCHAWRIKYVRLLGSVFCASIRYFGNAPNATFDCLPEAQQPPYAAQMFGTLNRFY